MDDQPLDPLQGTLDVLVRKALTWQPMHGYAVSRWIRERSAAALLVEDAALYQALRRLERRGWIAAEWGPSENNRRAKYYGVTATGRAQLLAEQSRWQRYVAAVAGVLDAPTRDTPAPDRA